MEKLVLSSLCCSKTGCFELPACVLHQMNSSVTCLGAVWCLWHGPVSSWFGIGHWRLVWLWVGRGAGGSLWRVHRHSKSYWGRWQRHLEGDQASAACLLGWWVGFIRLFMRAYCLSGIVSLWFNIVSSWFARRIKDWHMGFYWPKNCSLSDSIPELSLLLRQKMQLP